MKFQYYKILYAGDSFPYMSSSKNIVWHCSKEFAEASRAFFEKWANLTGFLNGVSLQKITATTGDETIWEPDELYNKMKSCAYLAHSSKMLKDAADNKQLQQQLLEGAEISVDMFLGKKLLIELEEYKQEKNDKIYKKEAK